KNRTKFATWLVPREHENHHRVDGFHEVGAMRTIRAVDLFCGAGGSSSGLAEACSELGLTLDLTAINHWQVAVDTHTANHPGVRHLCESLDNLDPVKVWGARKRLDILWASPECTHH